MHEGRGILSMANSGKDTNKSQFFITYRSAKHLNGKHTVFGKVVGGIETLDAIEKIEVDKKDRPIEEVRILNVQVFTDPFAEVDEQLASELEAEERRKQEAAVAQQAEVTAASHGRKQNEKLKVFRPGGVGKFINLSAAKRDVACAQETVSTDSSGAGSAAKKKKVMKCASKLSDFSAW